MKINYYYDFGKKLLRPILRSITGSGVRKTLMLIKKEFPNLIIKNIRSNKKVFDWTIPPEWNLKSAHISDKYGKKIVDVKNNPLHIVSYSLPFNSEISKKKLEKKFYYLKKQPSAIPYVTSYYKKRWGFCITYNQFKNFLKNYKKTDKFKIFINSHFNNKGYLNYGELLLRGKSKKEILISTYICHPFMANNEISGSILAMCLIDHYKRKKLKYSIRFIFIPETIGSIAYLSRNLSKLKKNVFAGFNLTCVGDQGGYSCMLSKNEDSPSDKALIAAYKKLKIHKFKIYSFLERGSDERQYNSPGIDLPITSIFRSKYREYEEYHTSLDDFKFVTKKGIKGSFDIAKQAINILQNNIYPKANILCEPQLSKRGIQPKINKKFGYNNFQKCILDFLQYSDGKKILRDIAKIIKTDLKLVKSVYKLLLKKKLIV